MITESERLLHNSLAGTGRSWDYLEAQAEKEGASWELVSFLGKSQEGWEILALFPLRLWSGFDPHYQMYQKVGVVNGTKKLEGIVVLDRKNRVGHIFQIK